MFLKIQSLVTAGSNLDGDGLAVTCTLVVATGAVKSGPTHGSLGLLVGGLPLAGAVVRRWR